MSFLRGIWDFIVGDDALTAFGVVVALGVTAILQSAGVTAWWLAPVATLALLAQALARAAARR